MQYNQNDVRIQARLGEGGGSPQGCSLLASHPAHLHWRPRLLACVLCGLAGSVPRHRTALACVQLGDTLLMERGQPLEFDAKAASAYLKGRAEVRCCTP